MTITAARVEVLTAEVRVLMVGSRQVTLSVYRQLDRVSLGAMIPFGRVSVNHRADPYDEWHQIDLVGADRSSGILVASWFARTRYSPFKYCDKAGQWQNHDLAEETWDQVQDLPLIVLAGLR